MIASLHLADLGVGGTMRALIRRPKVGEVAGLRWADVAPLVPLAMSRPPSLRRAGLVAFWDDEESIDRFTETHPTGRRFAGGFHARLRPLRAFGSWPGLAADVPGTRTVPHDGPVVVTTLGRLRVSQAVRFLRTSRPAEKAATVAEGLIWGTAAARPPFVMTISIWQNSEATTAYAFGQQRPQHHDAIAEQRRKDFHKQSAFVRFAPIRMEGALDAPNPLSAPTVGA